MTANFLASVALLVFLSITICFAVLCMSVLLCCCALFPAKIVGTLLCCAGSSFIFGQNSRQNGGRSHYNTDSSISETPIENSQINGIALAEAFVVAPFAEARIMKDSSTSNVEGQPATNQVDSNVAESTNVDSNFAPMIFRDSWAAAVFILQVIVIVWFAAEVSLKSIKVPNPTFEDDGLGTIVAACAVLAIAATFMGTISLSFILQKADYIIEGVMWMNIGVCAIGSILCLASGGTFLFAAALGFTAVINYCYMNSVRSRIPFASAVLSVACQAVRDNFTGTIISAYFLLAVQLGWVILWSIAAYGVSLNYFKAEDGNKADRSDRLSGSQYAIIFFFLLSMHWGSEVIKAVLAVTVNGVIACWWFLPSRGAVVRGAMFRSLTTSFGSVCLGSLLVSIIHTLRNMLQVMSNRERNGQSRNTNDILDCIFGFLLSMMDKAVTYFNKYAFCYVAGYGMGYTESARKVIKLFNDRGWTAIINDDLVGNFLIFAMFGMTVLTALLGFFSSILLGPILERADISEPYIMLTVIGGLMGYAVSSIFTNVLSSGVTMVFVCMAENPSALEVSNVHKEIVNYCYFNLICVHRSLIVKYNKLKPTFFSLARSVRIELVALNNFLYKLFYSFSYYRSIIRKNSST